MTAIDLIIEYDNRGKALFDQLKERFGELAECKNFEEADELMGELDSMAEDMQILANRKDLANRLATETGKNPMAELSERIEQTTKNMEEFFARFKVQMEEANSRVTKLEAHGAPEF